MVDSSLHCEDNGRGSGTTLCSSHRVVEDNEVLQEVVQERVQDMAENILVNVGGKGRQVVIKPASRHVAAMDESMGV